MLLGKRSHDCKPSVRDLKVNNADINTQTAQHIAVVIEIMRVCKHPLLMMRADSKLRDYKLFPIQLAADPRCYICLEFTNVDNTITSSHWWSPGDMK